MGRLNNLRVVVNGSGVSIGGSMAKYHLGSNLERLTRGMMQEAVSALGDALGLPIDAARVSRLEIGANIITARPVSVYLPLLGEAGRYKRSVLRMGNGQGVYYTVGGRTLAFYDKVRECRARHVPLPEIHRGRHVLRYELRFARRLPSQLKVPALTASMLFDEAFYRGIMERWRAEYFAIRREREHAMNADAVRDVRAFKDQLAAMQVHAMGGASVVLEMIDGWKREGRLTKMQSQRLRSAVRELGSLGVTVADDDLIGELDQKIKRAANYYR
jgi:hypothetical protein